MLCEKAPRSASIELDKTEIVRVQQTKLLGVVLSSDLNWH